MCGKQSTSKVEKDEIQYFLNKTFYICVFVNSLDVLRIQREREHLLNAIIQYTCVRHDAEQ